MASRGRRSPDVAVVVERTEVNGDVRIVTIVGSKSEIFLV
jgi:hypothetical protein